MWAQIATIYAIGACVMGTMVSAMDTVNFRVRGRPVPCARLVAGIFAGIIWPAVIYQMIMPRRDKSMKGEG